METKTWKRFVPSPAMAVAILALSVGVGGTSYAAATIGSADIRNGAVQTEDIANSTIKSRDVGKDTLKSWDIADGTIQAKDVKAGTIPGKTRWLLVNAAGQIEAQSGGFSVTSAYAGTGNVYINTGEDLSDNGLVATVADNGASGEISVSRCGLASAGGCAVAAANNANHLVVSPRNSDGTVPADANRKRFFVVVTSS